MTVICNLRTETDKLLHWAVSWHGLMGWSKYYCRITCSCCILDEIFLVSSRERIIKFSLLKPEILTKTLIRHLWVVSCRVDLRAPVPAWDGLNIFPPEGSRTNDDNCPAETLLAAISSLIRPTAEQGNQLVIVLFQRKQTRRTGVL